MKKQFAIFEIIDGTPKMKDHLYYFDTEDEAVVYLQNKLLTDEWKDCSVYSILLIWI